MTIKFETEKDKRTELVFSDVQCNQFFIDANGWLCQKISLSTYNTIANRRGVPFALHIDRDVDPCDPITDILPHVTKITWE